MYHKKIDLDKQASKIKRKARDLARFLFEAPSESETISDNEVLQENYDTHSCSDYWEVDGSLFYCSVCGSAKA